MVIVAEDDGDIRDLLTLALHRAGYRAATTGTGSAAAKLLTSGEPSGLITDVSMPDMSGLDLCRLAGRTPALRNIAILMFSASTLDRDMQAGLDAGADRYLPKPLRPGQVIAELDEILATPRNHLGIRTPVNVSSAQQGPFKLAHSDLR
ncbi:response regulator [Actinoplanes xinjiangensis]|uniref:response regulator n=1 Tax=Actinoplanes xinjiangensis TaxID=512350 RepID=UPI00343FA0A3